MKSPLLAHLFSHHDTGKRPQRPPSSYQGHASHFAICATSLVPIHDALTSLLENYVKRKEIIERRLTVIVDALALCKSGVKRTSGPCILILHYPFICPEVDNFFCRPTVKIVAKLRLTLDCPCCFFKLLERGENVRHHVSIVLRERFRWRTSSGLRYQICYDRWPVRYSWSCL
jgi:hypothetical protein